MTSSRVLLAAECCPRAAERQVLPGGRPHCVALYSACRAGACAKGAAALCRRRKRESRCDAEAQQIKHVVIVPAHAYEHEHVYEYKHECAYGNSNRPFETYPFKLPLAW